MTPASAPLRLEHIRFNDLTGWRESEPKAALSAFRLSCGQMAKKPDSAALGGLYAGRAGDWRTVCAHAESETAAQAREFFETDFVAYRVSQGDPNGLFTGYYEPELKGSRTRHGAYQTPLYGVPADLVAIDLGLFRDALMGQKLVGRVTGNKVVPYPARAEIARMPPKAAALCYVDSATDAFFLQIQGSGRVVLDDGSAMRAVYAAQNGQPYTAIGAVLIERGELKREEVSLQTIRAWLAAHPHDAQELMNKDASFVFFDEQPIGDPANGAPGSEGVALSGQASLAVDTSIHALGVPAFIEATAPDADPAQPDRPFDRLVVMQDTGGAIKGAVRGDVYWGFGPAAEAIAGRMKSRGRLSVLLPKMLAARLGSSAEFTGPPKFTDPQ